MALTICSQLIFFIILISLDAAKNKEIVDTRIPKNINRPIDSEIKIKDK